MDRWMDRKKMKKEKKRYRGKQMINSNKEKKEKRK